MKRKWTPLRIVLTILSAILSLAILGVIIYFVWTYLINGGLTRTIVPIQPVRPIFAHIASQFATL